MIDNKLVFTIDLDWACEPAIIETVSFFLENNIPITVFATHNSKFINDNIDTLEVGLHPFFNSLSSHGKRNLDIANNILNVKHNLKAFRCHRFEVSNSVYHIMKERGYSVSSNVCTDLEIIRPFNNRFKMLEVPIFMEDGGYIYNGYPLKMNNILYEKLMSNGYKVIIVHPMHFAINTPYWEYMVNIKKSSSRKEWISRDNTELNKFKNKGVGITHLIKEITRLDVEYTSIEAISQNIRKDDSLKLLVANINESINEQSK